MTTYFWIWIIVWSFFSGLTARAAATNEWAVKLRQAVRLPQVAFNFEPNFNRLTGVVAEEEVVDPVMEIERLNLTLGEKIEDAPLRLRLFRLALLTGDTIQIALRRTEALAACQAWAAAAPTHADALVGLGRILWLTGDESAAEPLLRRAVELQPSNWAGWVALGEVLGSRSLSVFTGWGDHAPPNAMGLYFSGQLKPAGDPIKARALFDEAVRCEERAVAAVPLDPKARIARLPFLLDQGMRRRVLADPKRLGERQEAVARKHQAEAAPEVEAVLKGIPGDHRLLGLSIYLRVLPELAEAGVGWNGGSTGGRAVDALTLSTRTWLEERLNRLEKLSPPNPPPPSSAAKGISAAGAAELLAIFRYSLYGDSVAAERWARQALGLDPTRRGAFEVVTAGLVREQRWQKLEEFCRLRLRVRDDPTTRLVLAKAQFSQSKKEDALQTLSEANEKYPSDRLLLAALCSARLALNVNVDEAAFAARLSRLFPDPANALDETDANHAVLLAALVSQALDGEVTIPKQVLRSALSANPADDYALTVLELIRLAPVSSK